MTFGRAGSGQSNSISGCLSRLPQGGARDFDAEPCGFLRDPEKRGRDVGRIPMIRRGDHCLGEQLERNAALVAKLPMPEAVQMRGRMILVGWGGEVVPIASSTKSESRKKRRSAR